MGSFVCNACHRLCKANEGSLKMNKTILKNELKNLLLDKALLAASVAFIALLAYGMFNAENRAHHTSLSNEQITAEHRSAINERRDQVAAGFTGSTEPGNFKPDPTNPFTMSGYIQYVTLPVKPAAIFAIGQSDIFESATGVAVASTQQSKAEKKGFENPLGFMVGKFDAAFVIIYLLPLFILAISFNILSAEREGGTLQLLLSQPVALKQVLLSKLAARFLFILPLAAIGLICGLAAVLFRPLSGDLVLSAFLWLMLVAAYTAFWLSVTALINSFGLSSSANAVVAISGWVLLVLVLPSLLGVVISSIYPLPPRSDAIAATRNVALEVRRDSERYLSEFYQDHPELIPDDGKTDLKNTRLVSAYIQAESKDRLLEVENSFREKLTKQQYLINYVRFLSPPVLASQALNELAGTDNSRFDRFRQQSAEYDKKWTDYFRAKIFKGDRLTVADYDNAPKFEFVERPLSALLLSAGVSISFILSIAALLFFLAFKRAALYKFD